jgi:hypothetical protein
MREKRLWSSVAVTRKKLFLFCERKRDKIRECVAVNGTDISDICSHKRDGLDSVVHNL